MNSYIYYNIGSKYNNYNLLNATFNLVMIMNNKASTTKMARMVFNVPGINRLSSIYNTLSKFITHFLHFIVKKY